MTLPDISGEKELVIKMLTDNRESSEIAKEMGISTKLLGERFRNQRTVWLSLEDYTTEQFKNILIEIGGGLGKKSRWFRTSPTVFHRYAFEKLMSDEEFIKHYCEDDYLTDDFNESIGIPNFLVHETISRRSRRLGINRNEKFSAKMLERKYYNNEAVKNRAKVRREKTMLKRYGVSYPLQSINIQNKTKSTNLERYGSENVMNSPLFLELTSNNTHKPIVSKLEKQVGKCISNDYNGNLLTTVIKNYRPEFLNGKEIDIFISNPDINYAIGIEVNGSYWHDTKLSKYPTYHNDKYNQLINNNVYIFIIWEYMWSHRKYPFVRAISRMSGNTDFKEINICDTHTLKITKEDFIAISEIHSIEKYRDTIEHNSKFYGLYTENRELVLVYELTNQNVIKNVAIHNKMRIHGTYSDLLYLTKSTGILLDNDYSNYLGLNGYKNKKEVVSYYTFPGYKRRYKPYNNAGFSIIIA